MIKKKKERKTMTEKEFLELVNLVEFESKSLDNFELEDKEKDKSIRKSLKVLKTFIKKERKV